MPENQPPFRVVLDEPPADLPDAFRVYLGRPAAGAAPDPGSFCLVEAFSDEVLARLKELDPKLFSPGLAIVVSSRDYPDHRVFMDRAIKHLAFSYCKFVYYPRFSVSTPDLYGLRKDQGVNLALEASKLRNLSLFVRHPLLDKLAVVRVGKPVLLLLPGPSLAPLGPRLREMARKCLVVCLSRTLGFCLEHGVTPDFVVQLDVHYIQPHFYPAGQDFSRSTLVCLSLAPVSGLAERFGRLFFMDSFNLNVLPNAFRMRESWLSSFISCLGLAEVLAAREVFVAGADLCLGEGGERYAGAEGFEGVTRRQWFPRKRPVLASGLGLLVPDRSGWMVHTSLPYYATAAESEELARALAGTAGVRFFALTDEGILDPEVFRPARPEDVASREDLDRNAVAGLLDKAHAQREPIDFLRLKVALIKQKQTYDAGLADLRVSLLMGDPEKLANNPYVVGAKYYWDYIRDASPLERVEIALRQLDQAQELLRAGIVSCDAHLAAKRGRPVWTLCLEDEVASAGAEAAAVFPGIEVRPLVVWVRPGPQPTRKGTTFVNYAEAFDQLRDRKPLLVTRRAFAEFAYMFRSLPLAHWLRLGAPPAV